MTSTWQECQALQDWIVGIRRTLHCIPELEEELPETQAAICKELDALGIDYKKNTLDSGIIGMIQGGKAERDGKTILLRADMDALPVTEETGLSFAPAPGSKHADCMHACGHDAHMAMLLGALRVLNDHRDDLTVNVKFVFQTDEESGSGAKNAIKEGALDGVQAVFGMHIGCLLGPDIPSGTLAVLPGPCMASCGRFVLTVKGVGCHGSTPERGIDPVTIAANIVLALQEIVTREVSGLQPAVLTIGKISGGFAYNVIPDSVIIEGTTRTYSSEVQEYLLRRIKEISRNIAAAYRGECECVTYWNASPVVNDTAMAKFASDAAVKVLGTENVITSHDPMMVSEDFGYYLERVPGAFLFLSSSDHGKGSDIPHHSPKFKIDEDVLYKGSAVFVALVEEYSRSGI